MADEEDTTATNRMVSDTAFKNLPVEGGLRSFRMNREEAIKREVSMLRYCRIEGKSSQELPAREACQATHSDSICNGTGRRRRRRRVAGGPKTSAHKDVLTTSEGQSCYSFTTRSKLSPSTLPNFLFVEAPSSEREEEDGMKKEENGVKMENEGGEPSLVGQVKRERLEESSDKDESDDINQEMLTGFDDSSDNSADLPDTETIDKFLEMSEVLYSSIPKLEILDALKANNWNTINTMIQLASMSRQLKRKRREERLALVNQTAGKSEIPRHYKVRGRVGIGCVGAHGENEGSQRIMSRWMESHKDEKAIPKNKNGPLVQVGEQDPLFQALEEDPWMQIMKEERMSQGDVKREPLMEDDDWGKVIMIKQEPPMT